MNNIVDFLVEIPANSYVKYEFDKDEGFLRCDRILHTSMSYPGNYGYIPKTLARDGDPIDVLMIPDYQIHPMTLVKVRIIGALIMKDEKGEDEKLIVVPDISIDPYYVDFQDIKDVPKHLLAKIRHFFEHYKDTEPKKWVEVEGFCGAKEATQMYFDSKKNYNQLQKKLDILDVYDEPLMSKIAKLDNYDNLCGNL